MKLTCYAGHEHGPRPEIRPAPAVRDWMATSQSFATRCLPLNIANSHGWELLCPVGFDCVWDGGNAQSSLAIRMHERSAWSTRPRTASRR